MVSGGFDYDVLVWNPYVERLILRLHGHNAPIVGVEMVPDTPQIVTGDASGIIKVWDIRTFTCMQTFVHDDTGHHTDMMKWLQVNVYMPWVNYSSWLMTTPALLFQIQDIVGRRE